MEKFRHEYKYLCTQAQMADLENRVKALLPRDTNLGNREAYQIRSVYFDDMYDSCYFQNEDGFDPRRKYRIRIYDGDDTLIKLERKKKVQGMTSKDTCTLSREWAKALIEGRVPEITPQMPWLLKYFIGEMNAQRFTAKVVVEYARTPYIYQAGNIRVTFDRNISSVRVRDFWEKDLYRRPIMPLGQQLLEVKFDEYLPDFIYHALNRPDIPRTNFSKYYLCRRFSL